MATFSNCLQIVNAMPQQDQDALLARLDELQAQGMSPKEAQLQAAIDVLAQVEREGGIRKSASRITDTPAFKRWFGDSKVVDENGKPLVVYHGTNADFDAFQDPKKMSDLGFHFGTVAQANSFAPGKKGSNVMPVYLSIKNPLQMRDVFGPWYGARASMASELVRLGVISEAESERITNARTQGAGIKLIKDAIERAGYDGVRYFNTREGDRLAELPDDVEVVRNYDGPSRIKNADGSTINRGFRFSVVHDKYGVMGGGDTKQEALADAREAVEAGNFANGEEAWIAFRPEQIKSAIGNNGDFNPNEPSILKTVDRPQFYSQLQRAVESVPARLDNMGAAAWKQWLTANAPKLGVKAEEVEWSGIKDYLDLQGKAKLSKDDLARYLDESGVKISEVTLGGAKDFAAMTDAQLAAEYERIRGYKPESYGEPMSREEIIDELDGTMEDDRSGTKYAQYTLPGGENYREVLITLPTKEEVANREQYSVYDQNGELIAQGMWPPSERSQARLDAHPEWRIEREIVPDQNDARRKGLYQSSHWDEPNVLAHIRINDRTDADGKRVLFVEEVQSDWGQDGKKKGFNTPLKTEGWTAKRGEGDPASGPVWEVRNASGQWVLGIPLSYAETPDAAIERAARRGDAHRGGNQSQVPAAPFVTKTEGWLNLALKRIAMMAVEGGYDKVAFVNGEQSADRYDLSKSIESIGYDPKTKTLEAYDKDRRQVMKQSGIAEDDLEDHIGKEVAKRLLATEPVMGKHLLDGEDIKVGGEGMKAFYDQIVPQAVNKLLPKIGGKKLGMVAIGGVAPEKRVDSMGFDASEIQFKRDGNGNWTAERGEQYVKSGEGRYWTGSDWSANDGDARVFPSKESAQASVTAQQQPGFDVTDKMRETVGQGLPLFSKDRTQTTEFKRWFGDSKVVDENGKPLVVYHGTAADFTTFALQDKSDRPGSNFGFYFTPDRALAEKYYGKPMAVYLSINNPKIVSIDEIQAMQGERGGERDRRWAVEAGYDGARTADGKVWIAFEPTQIKSATGNNGQFDPANPDIRKSPARPYFEDLAKLKVSTNYQLGDLLKTSKKLSWWDRTVGTQYNLAQKHPEFKRVFDAVQTFINDVSAYATRAADMAQDILPKLETWRDIGKAPLSAADIKALRDPIFGGTLNYTRDDEGNIVETDDVQKAGVVFTDEELRSRFNLTDKQIDLYRQFRKATDQSITDLALSDMLRYLGDDGADIREAVMASGNVDVAVGIIKSHLEDLAAAEPRRAYLLGNITSDIEDKSEQANRLMDRGYAPLSRFGQYTVYVVGQDGEQIYFSMFENERDANKMAREMREQYPDATVTTGTMSQESYKLFSGVTPETLALFGEALGLEESGIDTKSEAYQTMLKVAKTNRSAMKRLIQRKGVDGFSEDAGRVLAGFVYSNARQISTNLHAGAIGKAASDVKDGDVKDQAVRLMEYIQNPQEEAQAVRGLLFTQFIGGSVASAMVNMTQPFTMTLPYLSQFGGASKAGKAMADALKLVSRGIRNDDDLKQALKRAEDEGVVSPQEVHQLMAQAQGKGQLQSGDGTRIGDAMAKTNNFVAKLGLGWGKLFSAAEQFNRRITFIAAYKLAREQGIDSPFAFAQKAIAESQGVYNKGNKPNWARGAVGGTLFTFKQYSIAYIEFLRRMWGNGPEGKKAVGLALAVLFMTAGLGGMPGADDMDDVIDGFAQRVLGKSFDSKQAKKEFFASILGQTGAEFVMGGLTGIPGAPIDLSGRMGLGNLIPGTGILTKKKDYGRDVSEVFGPAGTFFANIASAAGNVAQGEFGKAAESVSPVAVANVIKAADMATMGMYRDQKGRKVIDVDGWEAAVKALGFQPASVKRIQDATSTQQGLIAQNKLRETEIADKWAAGRIERDPAKVAEAQAELAEWNRKNPDSPIRIDQAQINKRVQQAMMDKAKRLEKTAPKEIRQSVRQELERAN